MYVCCWDALCVKCWSDGHGAAGRQTAAGAHLSACVISAAAATAACGCMEERRRAQGCKQLFEAATESEQWRQQAAADAVSSQLR